MAKESIFSETLKGLIRSGDTNPAKVSPTTMMEWDSKTSTVKIFTFNTTKYLAYQNDVEAGIKALGYTFTKGTQYSEDKPVNGKYGMRWVITKRSKSAKQEEIPSLL